MYDPWRFIPLSLSAFSPALQPVSSWGVPGNSPRTLHRYPSWSSDTRDQKRWVLLSHPSLPFFPLFLFSIPSHPVPLLHPDQHRGESWGGSGVKKKNAEKPGNQRWLIRLTRCSAVTITVSSLQDACHSQHPNPGDFWAFSCHWPRSPHHPVRPQARCPWLGVHP